MIMLTGIVIIEFLMNILTVFRVHSIRIIKNSFRVSTPLIEKENITNFVTKLHVLCRNLTKLGILRDITLMTHHK